MRPMPAKRGQRRGAGEEAPDRNVRGGDPVRPAQGRGKVVHHHPDVPAREVRAVAPVHARAHGGETSVLVEGELTPQHVVARLVVGHEALSALRRPRHRPTQPSRRHQQQRVLGVGAAARAEATAGVRHDHAKPLDPDAQHVGHQRAHPVRRLAADLERPPGGGGLVGGDGRARLEEHRGDAVVDDLDPGDVGGPVEGARDGGRVATLPFEGHVARAVVPDPRRAGRQRLLHLEDRRQRLVLHAHEVGRVLRAGRRVGHDERDRLARVAGALTRQRVLLGVRRRPAVATADVEGRRRREGGNRPRDLIHNVGRGQHEERAGGGPRGHGVDAPDDGVRVRRADDDGMGRALRNHVRREPARPGQKARVLPALERRPRSHRVRRSHGPMVREATRSFTVPRERGASTRRTCAGPRRGRPCA